MNAQRQPPGRSGRPGKHRLRRTQVRVMVLCLVTFAMMMVALPTFVVLIVGLLPTFTWFIVDLTPGRYAFRCIAGFNAAGLAPFLFRLWTGGNDMSAAVDIVGDPLAWLIFLSAAGGGWLTFQIVPAVISFVMTMDAERKVRALRAFHDDLKDEWGPTVAGEPIDDTTDDPAGGGDDRGSEDAQPA